MMTVARGGQIVVALLPVLTFLAVLVYLDSYKLVRMRTMLVVLACGAAVAVATYPTNAFLLTVSGLDVPSFTRYVGPIAEELLKAVVIVVLISTHRIGFLVDAAIFGFAVGAGFSLVENLYYLEQAKDATMATWITQLGGTNVQSSAPEVRDILEKGVAEAVTFPWGSIPLFGIDKVTKYHMEAPLYATSFVWVMNKAKYNEMSAAQKKVIDDHCTTQWAIRAASPWADFEHAGIKKLKDEGHEVYPLTDAQLAEWKKSAEPVVAAWADAVKKAGNDPDAVMKDFKAVLAKYKSAY